MLTNHTLRKATMVGPTGEDRDRQKWTKLGRFLFPNSCLIWLVDAVLMAMNPTTDHTLMIQPNSLVTQKKKKWKIDRRVVEWQLPSVSLTPTYLLRVFHALSFSLLCVYHAPLMRVGSWQKCAGSTNGPQHVAKP